MVPRGKSFGLKLLLASALDPDSLRFAAFAGVSPFGLDCSSRRLRGAINARSFDLPAVEWMG
jgi:hypothetical protein